MTDGSGQWTDQKFEWTLSQSLRCHLRDHESRGKESPSKTLTNLEPRLGQAHSDRCRKRIGERLRTTPLGGEKLDRRNELINEALAEEVQRGEQRTKRSDKATAAVPESEPASCIVDSRRRRSQSLMMNRESMLRIRKRWALVKAQSCPEHRQQTSGEDLL